MAVTAEGLGSIDANRADGSIKPEELGTIQTESSTVEQVEDTQPQATGPSPDTDEMPAPGPVPYERFYEVNEARKELEATLQSLGPIQAVYQELSQNPQMAQAFAQAIQQARGTIQQTAQQLPQIDESLMTETERGLHRQNQALAQRLDQLQAGMSQAVATSQETANQMAEREIDASLSGLESWAHDKGYPFDAQKVVDVMDDLNIEGLIARGRSVEDIAMMAYRAAHFDDLPQTVKSQTYAEQRNKARGTLASPASRSGGVSQTPRGVAGILDSVWKDKGLPE